MNYKEWSDEYFRDAEKLLKTVKKYEKKLKEGDFTNREKLNATIFAYRNIYYDMLNTGKYLLAKANGEEFDAA